MSRLRPRALAALLSVLALGLAGCGGDGDEEPDAGAVETGGSPAQAATEGVFGQIPGIVDQARPSVVAVFARAPGAAGEGSGVIWDEDGLVVTNNHVVQGAREVRVQLASGERLPAEIRAGDRRTDLAVLEIDRDGLPAAEFSDRVPAVGELAVALGNPLGFESSVTAGIVSGLDRNIPTGQNTPALVGLVQTDAAISPGNSGGALVDSDGRVIGINVAFIPPEQRAVSIGFAIPSPTVIDVVRELLEDGEVEEAFLGVGLDTLTPGVAERFGIDAEAGAIVVQVSDGGPADEAGLRRGDVIVRIGDDEVAAVEDVLGALRKRDPGDVATVTVVRDGERRELQVRLDERPEDVDVR